MIENAAVVIYLLQLTENIYSGMVTSKFKHLATRCTTSFSKM